MQIFQDILHSVGLNYTTNNVSITGNDPVLPTPYLVGEAGASALAAVGYLASEIWFLKTKRRQMVKINVFDAALAQQSHQYVKLLNDDNQPLWDPLSGFYLTKDNRYIQLHCNFPNHRQGVVNFLCCNDTKEAVIEAVKQYEALDLEYKLNELGLCAAMVRGSEEWLLSEQAKAITSLPLLEIDKVADSAPIPMPDAAIMPLSGIKVLDLTRVIAGPVCGRTLAELGATELRVDSPELPEVYQLALDTGRGKLNTHLNLKHASDKEKLYDLMKDADVFSEAYRPLAMGEMGLGIEELCNLKPGLIYVSLSAYSHCGPWKSRHGYDSLVQSATGIAARHGNNGIPKHLPCQTLDYIAGFLCAFGVMEALRRRAIDGGSYMVRTSLVQVANWLSQLGAVDNWNRLPIFPEHSKLLTTTNTALGNIEHLQPALQLSETPLLANLPVTKLGSGAASWPV